MIERKQKVQKNDLGVMRLIENFQPTWQVKYVPVRNAQYVSIEEVPDLAPVLAPVLESAENFIVVRKVGERFHEGFEACSAALGCDASEKAAIDYGTALVTYDQLEKRSNQLARFFQAQGIKAGSRIALLLDRSIDSYAAVLAASKLSAAYVPLDITFPADRIHYMLEDSEVSVVFTLAMFSQLFIGVKAKVIVHEAHLSQIDQSSSAPFDALVNAQDADALAYIIYTSGSTGRPKGVPIRHSSICNFMQVATKLYGYLPSDRVYQGLTIAFDFSFEEVWIPLFTGATLVPAAANVKLVGEDLTEFLAANNITALCCVPTMLATLEPNLPALRFLLLSGEACQADVVSKWLTPNRRVLNVYGPTETTVTATWSILQPNKPITIGGPLPTYQIVIVDPETHKVLQLGEVGEVCIAGVGLCDDYLNRPEKTEQAFMDDMIGLPDNPSKRLYRTGDLGKINQDHEIEYLGRIDTQVKIRGYRIELSEIESLARGVEGVEQAVVQPFDLDGSGKVLVAFISPAQKNQPFDMHKIYDTLKVALPSYMMPAYYEQLDEIPILASGKTDRNALKPPTSHKLVASEITFVAPETSIEKKLSALLASVLKIEKISTQAHFFNDLGADSLNMAAYVTSIRNHMGLRQLSMRQLYENASIALLAKSIEDKPLTDTIKVMPSRPRASDIHKNNPFIASNLARASVGLAQTIIAMTGLLGLTYLMLYAYHWIEVGQGFLDVYLRAVLATSSVAIITSLFLIATKWLSIGKFTNQPIPIWSFKYFRFWVARKAMQLNPMNVFVGTPLYNVYLRLLGAKVGRNCVILTKAAPICTDLICIGDGTVIRENVIFNGYIAKDGYLFLGNIDIGANVLICEDTVLEIHTKIGNNAQIGMVSALREGQIIPASVIYQGTPAEPSTLNYLRVQAYSVNFSRKCIFVIADVVSKAFSGAIFVTMLVLFAQYGINESHFSIDNILVISGILYVGGLILSMLWTIIVPRFLHLWVIPDVAHPLYGFQHELVRTIAKMTNHKLFNLMFGDSAMVLYWLSALGYDVKNCTQSGSNFGVAQTQHSPYLTKFNENTMVADGLNLLNVETSSSSFILRKINVPKDNYFGNKLHYPAFATLGENCLIGTKAAFPIDGTIKSNTGLLGSPVFEIPRTVLRDQQFNQYKQPEMLKKYLAMKLRSNLITLVLYMVRSWGFVALLMLLYALSVDIIETAIGHSHIFLTALEFTLAEAIFIILFVLIGIFCERLVCGFRRLLPKYCSIYDPQFWAHERFWKQSFNEFLAVLNGTPFKSFFIRLQGAKVGKRLFDDGSGFAEPSMVEIGDDCVFNDQAFIQCHSLEDGTFKSYNIVIGSHCHLGINTFIQYGVVMENNTVLESNALLMKGSFMKQGTSWYGNPAREDIQG